MSSPAESEAEPQPEFANFVHFSHKSDIIWLLQPPQKRSGN